MDLLRNCLAFLGIVFLLALLIAGIIFVLQFQGNMPGIVIQGTPVNQATLSAIATANAAVERTASPPLPSAMPTSTPTPVPNPAAYKEEVLLRAKHFATTMDELNTLNAELQKNQALMKDPTFLAQATTVLNILVEDARGLSGIGGVPETYQAIQQALNPLVGEAEQLRKNYLQGVALGDQQALTAAGDNINQIRATLTNAQQQMVAAGW